MNRPSQFDAIGRGRLFVAVLCAFQAGPPEAFADEPFVIQVVDAENGWPVPLVALRTTSNVRFVTDNAGRVAFDLPEMMGKTIWLHVKSDGYEVKPDGFGYEGVRVVPKPGESRTIEVDRTMIAKRVGRLTGSGRFGESRQAGLMSDWEDQGVVGCDTVRVAAHRDHLHWIWGDTNLPHYPLGLFHTLAATTANRPLDSFRPPLQMRFDYFRDERGRPRNTAEFEGKGPTWLGGLVSLPDADDRPTLVASYVKVKQPMVVYRTGLCIWNEEAERFESIKVLWEQGTGKESPPPHPRGHATFWTDENQKDWVLFGDPFPFLRCRPTVESWSDPNEWESLDAPKQLESVEGKAITVHRGSIAWNENRQAWICVFCEAGGEPSPLGEIWFTEADHPLGPWKPAVKILSHQDYSFYNPRIARELTPPDASFILFEGTYTRTYSGNPVPTPRYNYNQILYRLDWADLPIHRERRNR